ncbi:MAG: hypothetical protein RBT41_04410 [Clostridia bacterium]|jgi:hypothetical protein|nr:hypothetical protein [Clostridia bacterium]
MFIFCLPAILTRFLQDYDNYVKAFPDRKKPAVYTIVNCGFPEPENNTEAVRVIRCFGQRIGAEFRSGVLIGGGGMLTEALDSPMVKKVIADISRAITRMKEEITSGQGGASEDVLTKVRVPRLLYFFMGGMGWRMAAKKYGLKKKELYARPYMPSSI